MSLIRRRSRKSKTSSNPYAARGLDKFDRVSAELAQKRQQLGAPDSSFVRFSLGPDTQWIPIVVQPSDQQKKDQAVSRINTASSNATTNVGSNKRCCKIFKCKCIRYGSHKKKQSCYTKSSTTKRPNMVSEVVSNTQAIPKGPVDESHLPYSAGQQSNLHEKRKKRRAVPTGASLSAFGMIIVLGGLLLGRITAFVGVVCWWYALFFLRKAAKNSSSS